MARWCPSRPNLIWSAGQGPNCQRLRCGQFTLASAKKTNDTGCGTASQPCQNWKWDVQAGRRQGGLGVSLLGREPSEGPAVKWVPAAGAGKCRGRLLLLRAVRDAYTTVKLFHAPTASFLAPLNQRLSPHCTLSRYRLPLATCSKVGRVVAVLDKQEGRRPE